MKAGTVILLPDGREGTVVYNGLDGVGIKFGRHAVTANDIDEASRNTVAEYPWFPDAMLRNAPIMSQPDPAVEYVGEEFEIVRPPECN